MIPSGAIYLLSGITDMRKSIDGLSLIVADELEMDPLSSAWFIFCNRGRDKIKILFWDTNGFWLGSIAKLGNQRAVETSKLLTLNFRDIIVSLWRAS
ncbi:TPA: IS66 family insertion sequence element accessory protein TnpB [Photobacterium damselae]